MLLLVNILGASYNYKMLTREKKYNETTEIYNETTENRLFLLVKPKSATELAPRIPLFTLFFKTEGQFLKPGV
jgi:hypothetical protein